MKRRTLCLIVGLPMALSPLLAADNQSPVTKKVSAIAANDPLLFPKDSFIVETKTVKTSKGERKVAYRSYKHIPYVANPVDKDYQSLNVSVPIEVDGVAVNATNAPILLAINVGGYMSSSNIGNGMQAGAGGPPPGGAPSGAAPGGPPGAAPGGVGGPPGRNSNVSGNQDLALAAGYVVVTPGARGRDNKAADGTFYGKAPAAIVDLKAAVRYVRHNSGVMPGNTEWIVSTGGSAGGALSALLGASGNSSLYEPYLKAIGAANEKDNIFGSADFCPITDLDHADMAYEWMYGSLPARMGSVDQTIAKQLADAFVKYQASLNLNGKNGFGAVTADNFGQYAVQNYLTASANKFLKNLTEEKRGEYLTKNPWITWTDTGAQFAFADFVKHVGRMKGQPAFDGFNLKSPENNLFGNTTVDSKHFTNFSLQKSTGNSSVKIDAELQRVVNMMNPMYFIAQNNKDMADNWWIRQGSSDNDTALPVFINLATSLENRGKNVNAFLYWDGPHGADEDPEEFIAWMGSITGFAK